jgi:hypothetical protein
MAIGLALAVQAMPTDAQECGGDCNGDRNVSVDELIRGVRIALGELALGECASVDVGGDGTVEVADLIAAVGHLLAGDCAGGDGSGLRGALNGSQTAIGLIQIIDIGRASASGAGLVAATGGPAGFTQPYPPFLSACPDGGAVEVACATDGAVSVLQLSFEACAVCDRPPLLDTQLPAQLANARDIALDGLFVEQVDDALLCFTFNAPINPGASFFQLLDGEMSYTDDLSGLRFSQQFEELGLAGVVESDGLRRFNIEGAVADCEGRVELRTLESVRIASGAACPQAGRLRVTAGGSEGEIRYTSGGGVELDDGADGTVDERFDDCRAARSDACGLPDATPAACAVPRTQCLACSGDGACGSGRICVPCQRDCSGASLRCGPEILYAACEDGVFGPVELPQ